MSYNSENYFSEFGAALLKTDRRVLDKIILEIYQAYRNDRKILIIGNGGSASTASHFANDLSKYCIVQGKQRIKAIALTDNISTITAWANDAGYSEIFSEQILSLGQKDDLLILFSVSGNSPNLLCAVDSCSTIGIKTIGFLGFKGGKVKSKLNHSLVVECEDYGIVESIHLLLEHYIVNSIKKLISLENV